MEAIFLKYSWDSVILGEKSFFLRHFHQGWLCFLSLLNKKNIPNARLLEQDWSCYDKYHSLSQWSTHYTMYLINISRTTNNGKTMNAISCWRVWSKPNGRTTHSEGASGVEPSGVFTQSTSREYGWKWAEEEEWESWRSQTVTRKMTSDVKIEGWGKDRNWKLTVLAHMKLKHKRERNVKSGLELWTLRTGAFFRGPGK